MSRRKRTYVRLEIPLDISDGSLTRNSSKEHGRESMSPSIPVLFALLLALTSGSAVGGRGTTAPVALLRQTLRYWRKIYRTYREEVALGYCWAGYLLEISDELSANLSAPVRATGVRADARNRRKPFPENVTAAARQFGESRGARPRQKRSHASTGSAISSFARDPNGRRAAAAARWEIARKRDRRMTNEAGRGANGINGRKRITLATDTCVEGRRRADSIAPFHTTSARTVNPPLNPGDDDKVGPEEPKEPEEDMRRKVLRAATSHRGTLVGGAFGSRTFSLKLHRGRRRGSLGGHRFPSRWCPRSSRERNSRVSEHVARDRGVRGNVREVGPAPSPNNDGGWPTALSRSPFRRTNAESERRRADVVKLMDSKGDSSRVSPRAINRPRASSRPWKREELSRDSPLSRYGRTAEPSPLESRKNTGEAVERKLSRSKEGRGNAGENCSRRSAEGKCSRGGKNVSPAWIPSAEENGVFLSDLGRPRQQIRFENRGFSTVRRIPAVLRLRRGMRATRNSPSLRRSARNKRQDNEGSSGLTRNAMSNALLHLRLSGNQNRRSFARSPSLVSNVRTSIIGVLRTLGMFVQVGRQIMDIVESNAVLACTKEYLWIKITRWIDI